MSDEDELNTFFSKLLTDHPDLIPLVKKERAKLDRSVARLCPFGRCEICVDPLDNTIVSAIGPVGCPCDKNSKYYEALPKPGWPAKPSGRHGGRIARSRRRTASQEAYAAFLRRLWDE